MKAKAKTTARGPSSRRAGARSAAPAPAAVPAGNRALNFGNKWDYAPAPEDVKLIRIEPRHDLFINGRFVAPRSGRYFESINPATERTLAEIAAADETDVDNAVRAARDARENAWSKLPARERGKYLYRVARILQEKPGELAVLETMDTGRPVKESRGFDLPMAAAVFFYYAGWADKLQYAFPGRTPRPLGVAAQIISWKSPLLTAAWKIAPALACGNTVVFKPAETTSLTALRLARILQEAELPPGVVNIVTGAAATGAALANHPGVDLIAFAGGAEAGKAVAKAVARRAGELPIGADGRVLPGASAPGLTLELGGPAVNIVFEDAPVDQAVEGVIDGVYLNPDRAGGACSRLLVQEGVYPAVLKKLRQRIQTLRMGDPLDKNTDIGPIHSRARLDKLRELVQSAVDDGGELVQARCALPGEGWWHAPSILTNVNTSHRVAREEMPGPVLCVMTFRTPEEAVERANNTPHGPGAGVWTDKGSKTFNLVDKLRAGVVRANTGNKFDPASPFGGCKESGLGREGGRHGLAAYCRLD